MSTGFEDVLEFTRKPPAYGDVSVIELQGVPPHRFTVHSEKMLRTENCKPGSKVCLNRGRYLSSVTADSSYVSQGCCIVPAFWCAPLHSQGTQRATYESQLSPSILSRGFQGLNSGHQTCQQVPLPLTKHLTSPERFSDLIGDSG